MKSTFRFCVSMPDPHRSANLHHEGQIPRFKLAWFKSGAACYKIVNLKVTAAKYIFLMFNLGEAYGAKVG